MHIEFYKYQGTGNDFIMIDNRDQKIPPDNVELVKKLCHRRFGIGADGLILLQKHAEYDFEMVYFNSDGSQSMCGNGGRCAVMFAYHLGHIEEQTEFLAIDGPHKARVKGEEVALKMKEVHEVILMEEDFFIDTGSPHHLRYVDKLDSFPVFEEGRRIRYREEYMPGGTNVNFIEEIGNAHLAVRTYERGVEDETLSCGTGVTAAALSYAYRKNTEGPVKITTSGGKLQVNFRLKDKMHFTDIYLVGPAEQTFAGRIEIP